MLSLPLIEATPTGIRLRVRVQPRASRTELAGRYGDALKIRLAAPPVDGAANEALVRFLAERLEGATLVGGVDGRGGRSGEGASRSTGIGLEEAVRRLGL